MANLMDYLVWRGEFGMDLAPWNEVDALMMSNLCYLNFHGIDDPRGWTVAEAKRLDLLQEINKRNRLTVSWSVNTLDEDFKNDMDAAVSIERRLAAMKQVYDAGIRTVCFISPVFPGITDIEAIFERAKDQCDLIWLENLNLRGGFRKTIMDYIAEKYPHLMPLYEEIYSKRNRSYFEALEKQAEEMASRYGCRFVDNETPYERVPQGHPTIVDYFYHEEVRGSQNTGVRNKKEEN